VEDRAVVRGGEERGVMRELDERGVVRGGEERGVMRELDERGVVREDDLVVIIFLEF
jgi:hypothetical protein